MLLDCTSWWSMSQALPSPTSVVLCLLSRVQPGALLVPLTTNPQAFGCPPFSVWPPHPSPVPAASAWHSHGTLEVTNLGLVGKSGLGSGPVPPPSPPMFPAAPGAGCCGGGGDQSPVRRGHPDFARPVGAGPGLPASPLPALGSQSGAGMWHPLPLQPDVMGGVSWYWGGVAYNNGAQP